MTNLRAMPKVELHLHLEGAAPPEFIRALAAEQNVDLSGIFDDEGNYRWADFAEFLRTYEAACSVLTGPDEFRRLVRAVLDEQARHGVIYTEHFLAPDLCAGGDPGAWPDYLSAMCEGAAEAKAATGIECRFISTCIRHFGPERAARAARTTVANPTPLLTGFGMGGEERHMMPEDFSPAFEAAKEAGLGLTCHAGEICGADMVRATLDALPVTRIGHGVRAIEDPGLVDRIIGEGIVLEVNPGSNISLSVFDTWADHPIAALRDRGAKVTVSTDDPPYFATTMTDEYASLERHHGWIEADFLSVAQTAIDAAFCDEGTRDTIRSRLTA